MIINLIMEIEDSKTNAYEKQDVLRYCERAFNRTFGTWESEHGQYSCRIINRRRDGWTAEIRVEEWYYPALHLLHAYNKELERLQYWNRPDEPLIMYWDANTGK